MRKRNKYITDHHFFLEFFSIRTASGKEFAASLDRFKSSNGPNVLLLELKKGNKGLNITEASCVVFMEPVFNIALEKQVDVFFALFFFASSFCCDC